MLASSIWMCLFQLAWYLMVYKLPLYQRMLVVSTTDSVVDTQLCELCDTNGKILQKWGLYKAVSIRRPIEIRRSKSAVTTETLNRAATALYIAGAIQDGYRPNHDSFSPPHL